MSHLANPIPRLSSASPISSDSWAAGRPTADRGIRSRCARRTCPGSFSPATTPTGQTPDVYCLEGLFDKLAEETAELREELKAVPVKDSPGKGVAGSGKPKISAEARERLEDEVGDLFFVLVNIARFLALDSESALRKTNRKFKRRFQWMEERLHASGRTPQQASMAELEELWQQAKREEKLA